MPSFISFNGTLVQKKSLTSDVLYLSFQVPAEFTFKAGQFVIITMNLDGQTKPRSYSILNPPSESGKVDLCVKIIEGGFASTLFSALKVGDVLLMKGPFGHFLFEEHTMNPEHWFICTGTGVVPFYSMIKEYLPGIKDTKFVLLFGVRSKKDLFFYDEFRQLQQKYPQLVYLPTLSREQWEGKSGRVQTHLPTDLTGKTFYICGIKEVVLETKEYLLSRGVAPENIKGERYN